MNRMGWIKRLWLLLLIVMAVVYFAEARGYIGLGRDTINLMFAAAAMIIVAVLVRHGEVSLPTAFRTLRVGKLVWSGAGLVLVSVAWLLGGFALFGSDASYGTLVPFVILLPTGLFMLGAALLYKLFQAMLGK